MLLHPLKISTDTRGSRGFRKLDNSRESKWYSDQNVCIRCLFSAVNCWVVISSQSETEGEAAGGGWEKGGKLSGKLVKESLEYPGSVSRMLELGNGMDPLWKLKYIRDLSVFCCTGVVNCQFACQLAWLQQVSSVLKRRVTDTGFLYADIDIVDFTR